MSWKKYMVIGLLLLATGCVGEQQPTPVFGPAAPQVKTAAVSEEQFKDQWPLTISSGRVSCVLNSRGGQIVTFIASDGKEYSLNGTAKGSGNFLPIEGLWKPDPTNPPAKKNIGVLIDEGLKLCS
ncbi:DUF2511 domain-containing protein [Microcoleus sp. Pol11C1]|uniref:DUF2511 domain-containing protein n=1 Tax=unclassified Microcoleus TaxID=2642155 RepID=UPI002FD4203A